MSERCRVNKPASSVIDYGDVLYLNVSAHRLHSLDGEFHYRLPFSYSSLSIDALLLVHWRVFICKAAAERLSVYCSSLSNMKCGRNSPQTSTD